MVLEIVFGYVAGNLMPLLCCLVGLVLFAWRARGRARVLGIVGTVSLLLGLIFVFAWTILNAMFSLADWNQAFKWIAMAVAVLLQAGGLVLIGLAFANKRIDAPAALPAQSERIGSSGPSANWGTP